MNNAENIINSAAVRRENASILISLGAESVEEGRENPYGITISGVRADRARAVKATNSLIYTFPGCNDNTSASTTPAPAQSPEQTDKYAELNLANIAGFSATKEAVIAFLNQCTPQEKAKLAEGWEKMQAIRVNPTAVINLNEIKFLATNWWKFDQSMSWNDHQREVNAVGLQMMLSTEYKALHERQFFVNKYVDTINEDGAPARGDNGFVYRINHLDDSNFCYGVAVSLRGGKPPFFKTTCLPWVNGFRQTLRVAF